MWMPKHAFATAIYLPVCDYALRNDKKISITADVVQTIPSSKVIQRIISLYPLRMVDHIQTRAKNKIRYIIKFRTI